MVAQKMLEGNVLWSYEHELTDKKNVSWTKKIAGLFSFLKPLHNHEGDILLASNGLFIEGDEQLELPLSNIEEVYMGFDDVFPASSARNFGLFWQPIRIKSTISRSESQTVYLVINHTGIFSDNQTWFNTLINLLR
ncbi:MULTISPECIES: hypothetical protein [Pedobacter]|uniref:Uncharacterized protein n=1 Tax=Pedobacter zeae TaxID=1737356 RepID=A0A7W6P7D0_9SPHI|nr:hypothetical protein [Pedobacter zeae]MBB4108819.1 hypothetical protein [Pedobacter zeae]GGH08538.1 hypothetical protein GCM10007422_26140 [Pedobacter zeae]